jgi:hypothetical protein
MLQLKFYPIFTSVINYTTCYGMRRVSSQWPGMEMIILSIDTAPLAFFLPNTHKAVPPYFKGNQTTKLCVPNFSYLSLTRAKLVKEMRYQRVTTLLLITSCLLFLIATGDHNKDQKLEAHSKQNMVNPMQDRLKKVHLPQDMDRGALYRGSERAVPNTSDPLHNR